MQGRKPEEEIQHVAILHVYAKSRGGGATGLSKGQFRTPCETTRCSKNEFRTPCENSHGLRNLPVHQLR